MGGLWSRIRGKKTTYEILEGIDKDINRLQKSRKDNQESQKRVVTRLLIYSVPLYIIAALIFYFLYLPDTWKLRLLYSSPLLVFPILIWGLKRILHWYFVKRIAKNDLQLRDLREKKKMILEDVMETETYKKAREILEKFDPSRFRKMEELPEANNKSMTGTPGTAIQHRNAPRSAAATPAPFISSLSKQIRPSAPAQPQITPSPRPMGPRGQMVTPAQGTVPNGQRANAQILQRMPSQSTPQAAGRPYAPTPGPPMPRTVLPRERGAMDKLMDYLVGDGPENRFALICQRCYSHNGMALKEEFEFLSFRCCYCFHMNPARKQRPMAPRMEFFNPLSKGQPKQGQKESESSEEGESSSGEDEELVVEAKEKRNKPDSTVKTADIIPEPVEDVASPAEDGTPDGRKESSSVASAVSSASEAISSASEDLKVENLSDDSGNPDTDNPSPDLDGEIPGKDDSRDTSVMDCEDVPSVTAGEESSDKSNSHTED